MSDTVDVSTLPLARSLVTTLITHGFRFVSELKSLKPLDLAKELDISADDALLILQSVANPTGESIKSASAKEIYLQMEHSKSIITFSRSIDKLLGGQNSTDFFKTKLNECFKEGFYKSAFIDNIINIAIKFDIEHRVPIRVCIEDINCEGLGRQSSPSMTEYIFSCTNRNKSSLALT